MAKIIVGLGKGLHDSSVCASFNGEIKYAKYERQFYIKHGKAPEAWYWDVLKKWGIEYPDFLVYTDQSDIGLTPRLPVNNESHIKINHNHYLLDHHLAHLWSNIEFDDSKQAVCIDGRGSGNNTVLVKTDKLLRFKNCTPANVFNRLSQYMGLMKPGEFGNAAGKIMGLISYGKLDQDLYQKIKNLPLEEVISFCYIAFKENNKEWQNILATVDKVCFDFVKQIFLNTNINKEVFYSGGVALNVRWNTLLHKMGYQLNMDPAPYDGGLSIGAVRWAHHFLGREQSNFKNFPYIQEPYDSN